MSILQSTGTAVFTDSPRGRALHLLRGLIENGDLREGDRLPAESKLAAQFSVSRMTLRSALDVLEREGLVKREPNVGCVRAKSAVMPSSLMGRTIVLLSDHQVPKDGHVFNGSSAAIVSGVMDGVGRQSMNFLRINPNDNNDLWLRDLVSARPAGVVLSFWNRSLDWQMDVLKQLSAAKVPVVSWGDSPALQSFDCVGSDHATGTASLVSLLAKHGKRRIARLWTSVPETPWIQARNRGYEQAVAANGLESIPPVYVEGLAVREPITEATFRVRVRQFAGYLTEHLHSERPIDAIMVVTDCEAAVALAACRLYGRMDIAVTGYDNYWDSIPEREWEPAVPFATVEKTNHRLGEQMVELLLQRAGGALPLEAQHRLIKQEIVMLAGASAH